MDSIKDLVRDKMRIEEVIGSYVTLVPFGKNYKACCPFHNEKTPSFNINTDKQMFYCFGCKKGGDVFSFIQEIEHVDFKEALKLLAEKAGVDLRQSAELSKEMKQKKILLQIHEYATRFYQLLLVQQSHVLDYLKQRGLLADTVKHWRIGYAPDGFHQLTTILRKKGFSDQDLIASGLVAKGEKGLYDRFRGRIMFPITDSQGKVIAFSGRLMPGTAEAERGSVGKYINSPETMIYHKSNALFGFSFAKKTLAEKKNVILVEGQFDVILLHQAGYTNTVALSGTAGTASHVEQLHRFCSELIIATDSDHAGIQSAYKIAEIGYQFDCDISVVLLPEGKDPADIINQDKLLWENYFSDKKDYITFHGETTKKLSLRERIHAVETNLFPILAQLPNHVHRDAKLQSIANLLQVSQESIRKEFQKFLESERRKMINPTTQVNQRDFSKNIQKPTHSPLLIQIEELTLIHEHFVSETGFWFIDHPNAVELIKKHALSMASERVAELLVKYESLDSVAWKIRLDTLWIRIQQILLDMEIDALRQKMNQSETDTAIQELQQELLSLQKKKEELVRSLAE